MSSPITLATGVGGAIGCDFNHGTQQLYFVEFNGKVSRVDLIRAQASIVSQGTGTLHGTWMFDLDSGTEVDYAHGADIWWEQQTSVERRMTPLGDTRIANIGVVYFNSISSAELQTLAYDSTPIVGNDDPSNVLVTGDVFGVITRNGNYAKVEVLNYGYDMQIRWRTYQLQPAYQILGTGYNQPEDLVLSSDGLHAYVTERTGNLLRVDLSSANRSSAVVVSTGMTAPHQIALDEDHGLAYLVEYANPGRLLRINLTTGAQSTLVSNLEWAIGLAMTSDLQFAYVTEQAPGGNGRLTRVEVSTGRREELLTGMTNPFFLTWADAGEGGLLTTERDPANRISLIDLTQSPVSVSHAAVGVAFRPSSVAVATANRLLLCSSSEISMLDLLGSVYLPTGPIVLGIGHVPFDRIVGGYADTTVDPGYFFQVKDAPFGGTLSLMVNHERAYADGGRYYTVRVDGVTQSTSWSDYRWSTSTNRFELQTMNALYGAYFRVRRPNELWYNHWLGYRLNTAGLSNGLHNIEVLIYSASNSASLMSSHTLQVMIDNQKPTAVIDEIIHDGVVVGRCGIVNSGSDRFSFRITANDPQGHLKSWSLSALWGDNESAAVASQSYVPAAPPLWAGPVAQVVPAAPGWQAIERNCAHTFYLTVWDRVIDGYNYIHHSQYHKSITIMLP